MDDKNKATDSGAQNIELRANLPLVAGGVYERRITGDRVERVVCVATERDVKGRVVAFMGAGSGTSREISSDSKSCIEYTLVAHPVELERPIGTKLMSVEDHAKQQVEDSTKAAVAAQVALQQALEHAAQVQKNAKNKAR